MDLFEEHLFFLEGHLDLLLSLPALGDVTQVIERRGFPAIRYPGYRNLNINDSFRPFLHL